MKNFFKPVALIFITAILMAVSLNFVNAAEKLPVGTGVYKFAEKTGVTKDPINVYYHRPRNWKSGDKIFVVFHGMSRTAKFHFKKLISSADKKNVLLICPEFTEKKYPGSRYYNYGNVRGGKNYSLLNNSDKWTFNTVNRIIDDLKNRADASSSKVILFGHSAGAQFLHRYLFFADKIDADLVVAANAGAYLLPNEKADYPYGIKNVPVTENELKRAYESHAIIMLGESDVQRGKNLPTNPSAELQGKNRFVRGQNFFAQSQAKAAEIGAKFNWQMITVPNVAHSGVKTAKATLDYLK